MAAALCIGASGIITGTRLVASDEAGVDNGYKQAVVDTDPDGIVCTDRITGNRACWIASSIDGIDSGPDLGSRKWKDLWSAGQSVAQVEEIKPAGEIIKEMAHDCLETLREMYETHVDRTT